MKCPELLLRPVVDVGMENEVKLKWEDGKLVLFF